MDENDHFSHLNNLKDPKEKVFYANLIADENPSQLLENFQKFNLHNLPSADKADLFVNMLKNANKKSILLENINKIGTLENKDLYKIVRKIVDSQGFEMFAFLDNLHKLNLTEEQALNIAKIFTRNEMGSSALVENAAFLPHSIFVFQNEEIAILLFKQMNNYDVALFLGNFCTEIFQNRDSFDKRLELLEKIEEIKNVKPLLKKNFDHLGFERDLNACKSLEEALKIANRLSDKGILPISRGQFLKKSCLKFLKDCKDANQRLKLIKELKDIEGMEPILYKEFENIGFLEDITACDNFQTRSEILKSLLYLGNWAVIRVLKKIDKDFFQDSEIQERFDLANWLVEEGSASVFMETAELFSLNDATLEERNHLAKNMLSGSDVKWTLIRVALEKLGWDTFPFEQRITLLQDLDPLIKREALLEKDKFSTNELEKRQMCLDLLIPPHSLTSNPLSDDNEILPITELLVEHVDDEATLLPREIKEKIKNFQAFFKENPKLYVLNQLFDATVHKTRLSLSQRFKLMQWLAYSAGIMNDLTDTQKNTINQSGILEEIFGITYGFSIRYRYMRELAFAVQKNPLAMNTPVGAGKTEPNKLAKLSWIFLSRLKTLGLPDDKCKQIFSAINTKFLKHNKKYQIVEEFLSELIKLAPFNEEEIKSMNEKLLIKKDLKKKKDVVEKFNRKNLSDFQAATNIMTLLGRKKFFKCLEKLENSEDFSKYLFNSFGELFRLKDVEDIQKKYQTSFSKFRDEKAIYSYLKSVKKLPADDREQVKESLDFFVNSVLNKTFPKVRYKTGEKDEIFNPHLDKIFKYSSEIKNQWVDPGEPKESVDKKYKVYDTDNPCDWLLVGTDVKNSCQDINGNPHLNKCLMGYILNGNLKAIVMKKNVENTSLDNLPIVSRCLLRLMWDSANEHPVLVLERFYTNVKDPAALETLKTWAVEKAEKMGLPLVSKDIASGRKEDREYTGKVNFLGGGRAPYVYCDAAEGIMKTAEPFEVRHAHILS